MPESPTTKIIFIKVLYNYLRHNCGVPRHLLEPVCFRAESSTVAMDIETGELCPRLLTAKMVSRYSVPDSSPDTANSALGELEVFASTRGLALLEPFEERVPCGCPVWLTDSVKVCGRPPSQPD